jgi:hypothetical protein
VTSPQRDRGDSYGRPFSERFASSFPTIRGFVAVVALCGAIACAGQATQGHNADEIVFTAFALVLVGVAAWFLRDGFAAGSWMVVPVLLAAKSSGDSSGRWWVVVPAAAVVILALLLVDRRTYRSAQERSAARA